MPQRKKNNKKPYKIILKMSRAQNTFYIKESFVLKLLNSISVLFHVSLLEHDWEFEKEIF